METWKQGSGRLLAIFFCLLIAVAVAADRGEWEVPGDEGGGHEWQPFLMKKSEVVVKTEGGEIRVFRGHPWNGHPPRMHIGFVTMEPNTLIIPHYIDADLILFLLREKNEARRPVDDPVKAPDAYNIYDRDPDFRNDYGWSIEVNEHDYLPLKKSDISVFLVNLSAGSMMAPHVNPRATEYGVVVSGAGTVEVVYPNGTGSMKAKVKEGDVFWVPRFFPFCQVAAIDGSMEILGFTTSARRNRPQFLVGKNSILRLMMGKELAAGFGVREEELRKVVMKQNNTVILPSWEEDHE